MAAQGDRRRAFLAFLLLHLLGGAGQPATYWRIENAQAGWEIELYELTLYSDEACSAPLSYEVKEDAPPICHKAPASRRRANMCKYLYDGALDLNFPVSAALQTPHMAGDQQVDVKLDPPAEVLCVDAPGLGQDLTARRRRGRDVPYNIGIALSASDDGTSWREVARSLEGNRVVVTTQPWEEEDISDEAYNARLANIYRDGGSMMDSVRQMNFNGWYIKGDQTYRDSASYTFADDVSTTLLLAQSGGWAEMTATLRGSGTFTLDWNNPSPKGHTHNLGVRISGNQIWAAYDGRAVVSTPFSDGDELYLWGNWIQIYSMAFNTTTTSVTITATSTSTTSTTSTTTTSTTTPLVWLNATCNATHLVCPIPYSSSWALLGSEDDPECQARLAENDTLVFVLSVTTCNVQMHELASDLKMNASLVPSGKGALLVDQDVANEQTITCTCVLEMLGTATGGGTWSDIGDVNVVGSADFDLSLLLYTNETYETSVLDGEELSVGAVSRLYFEVRANAGNIGLVNCSTSHVETMGSSAHGFLTSSCPSGDLDFRPEVSEDGSIRRFSTKPFKFLGFSQVHVACVTERCMSPSSCGTCEGGRRLTSGWQEPVSNPLTARSLQAEQEFESDRLATATFVISGLTPAMVVLSVDALEEEAWDRVEFVQSLDAPSFNVTMYNVPSLEEGGGWAAFSKVVTDAVAAWLRLPSTALRATRVFALAGGASSADAGQERRRLEVALVEAVTVEIEFTTPAADVLQQQVVLLEQASSERAAVLTALLGAEFEAIVGDPLPGLRVIVRPQSVEFDAAGREQAGAPRADADPGAETRPLALVVWSCFGAVIFAVACCLACLVRKLQQRARSGGKAVEATGKVVVGDVVPGQEASVEAPDTCATKLGGGDTPDLGSVEEDQKVLSI